MIANNVAVIFVCLKQKFHETSERLFGVRDPLLRWETKLAQSADTHEIRSQGFRRTMSVNFQSTRVVGRTIFMGRVG